MGIFLVAESGVAASLHTSRPPRFVRRCLIFHSSIEQIAARHADYVRSTPHRECGTQRQNERMGTSVRWGDVFGDQIVAAAMIDRIVHHADVLTLKGASYRLHNTGIESLPSVRAENAAQ